MTVSMDLPEELRLALKSGNDVISSAACRQLGFSYGQIERLVLRGSLVGLAKGSMRTPEP